MRRHDELGPVPTWLLIAGTIAMVGAMVMRAWAHV